MKEILRALAVPIIITVVAALCVAFVITTNGCNPGWNDPIIPKPTPDSPCGYRWHSCGIREDGKHGCCYENEECRPGGYCAFVGDTFGAARDGGEERKRPGLPPEDARKAAPR